MNKILIAIIVAAAASLLCQGCNTSGCTDNQNSLPLAGFYSSTGEGVTISDIDISGVGQATDSLLYASGTSLHLVYLPFRSKYNTTSYVFHYTQSGIDSPEYNDTISFAYTSEPYFASEECGAMLTYTITGMTHTRHLIQSVEIVDSLITNTDIERIKIYFRTEQ